MPGGMRKTRVVRGALAVTLAVLLLWVGIGYFTGVAPFPAQKRGEIKSAVVCGTFGDRERAAIQLRRVLPSHGKYRMRGSTPPRASGQKRWRADCSVSGDGERLLYVSSELGRHDTDGWRNDSSRWGRVGGGPARQSIGMGEASVLNERTAGILVPCGPGGVDREDTYQLSVEVRAQKPLVGSSEEKERALGTLAMLTARHTHEKAGCSLPPGVPERATGLG